MDYMPNFRWLSMPVGEPGWIPPDLKKSAAFPCGNRRWLENPRNSQRFIDFLEVTFLQRKKTSFLGDAAQDVWLPESSCLDARGHLPQIFVDFRGYGGWRKARMQRMQRMGWEMHKSESWNRGGLVVAWYCCGFMAGSGSQNISRFFSSFASISIKNQ